MSLLSDSLLSIDGNYDLFLTKENNKDNARPLSWLLYKTIMSSLAAPVLFPFSWLKHRLVLL